MKSFKFAVAAAVALMASPVIAQSDADMMFEDPGMLTQTDGEDIYNAICSGCHMPEGEGAVGAGMYPALADNPNLEYPGYAIDLILHGQKAMPALGGVLSDEQIAAVVGYIRTSFGNDYADEVSVQEVTDTR